MQGKLSGIIFKTFLENRIISRWFVLTIDIIIVTLSTVISYYITRQIYESLPSVQHPILYRYLFFSVGITLVYFFLFKTYVGIVRYSTIHEFARCLIALVFASLSILGYLYLYGAPSGSISVAYCVSFLLFSLLGLFIFRIMVILVYRYLRIKHGGKTTSVYLWGVNEDTISLAQLLHTTSSLYKVKGFIDDGKHSKLCKNTNLPVLKRDLKLIQYKVKNILFTNEDSFKQNKEVAEKLLKIGIHVYISQDLNINNLNELAEISKSIRPIQIEDLLGRPEIEISKDSIYDNIYNKTILVTGAAGSIGSEIVRQLAYFSPKLVICLDQAETPLHALSLELEKINLKYKIAVGDVRRLDRMTELFDTFKPDIVYHAAAYKHVPLMEKEPSEAIIANVMGTKHMVDLSIENNVEMFVMVSTDKAVNPTNIMGASKRIAEIYAQSCALNSEVKKQTRTKFVTTRFGNVLGSNGSVIPLFKKQIESGGPITVTDRNITRYFMTIPEACRLVLESSVIGKSGYIYVFDMGEPVRIYDLAKKMIELAGFIPDKDIKIEISGLRPGEKLYEELLDTSELAEEITSHEKIKIAKVRQYEADYVESMINIIISAAQTNTIEDVVRNMKVLVPEFKSKNSKFSQYD